MLSLAIAILDSIDALFAAVLRDRSRGSRATTANESHATEFPELQRSMFDIALISAVATMLLAILGLVTAINPTWLRKYLVCQTIHGLMLVSIGGYAAARVRSCETEFGRLGAGGTIPYYNVIYYGYVGQAAYGFLLITLRLVFAAIVPVCQDTRVGRLQDSGSCWV